MLKCFVQLVKCQAHQTSPSVIEDLKIPWVAFCAQGIFIGIYDDESGMYLALLVAAGSALGGMGRYLIGLWMRQLSDGGFPYATLLVNILGSFLIVFIASLSEDERVRALVLIGFMGGFTTFSSFSNETLKLLMDDQLLAAALNVLISVSACLLAAYLGLLSGRAVTA